MAQPLHKKRSGLLLIYLVAFLDILGFGVIIPIIRDITIFLSKQSKLTIEPITLSGILMSSYSLAQFIFAPILGRLSDTYGRKKLLFLSVLGNVISYFMWIFSHTYEFFLISRLISGVTGGNISVAQSYLADITPKKDRAKAMGIFGAVFGAGFVLGPFLGSILIKWDMTGLPSIGAYFQPFSSIGTGCMLLSIINLVLIIFNLKESLSVSPPSEKRTFWKMPYLWKVKKSGNRLKIINTLWIGLAFAVCITLLEATIAWDLLIKFNLDTEATGLYFAGIGGLLVIMQGGVYRWLQKKFLLHTMIQNALLLMGLGFSAVSFASDLITFSLLLSLLVFSMSILNPSISAQISILSNESDQGAHLGILQSLNSLARALVPFLATFLYGYLTPILPYAMAAFFAMSAYFLAATFNKKKLC